MNNLPMTTEDGNAAPVSRQRNPHNAPGDFYTEANACIACCLSEAEAPDLLGFEAEMDNPFSGCFFKKQPETPDELIRAFNAMAVNCVATLRYGGTDPLVLRCLRELGMDNQCDYPLSEPPVTQDVTL